MKSLVDFQKVVNKHWQVADAPRVLLYKKLKIVQILNTYIFLVIGIIRQTRGIFGELFSE